MIDQALLVEGIGWFATGVFVASYFRASPDRLRRVQMAGAILWIVYGMLIAAMPVVIANALLFSAAAWTMLRSRRGPPVIE